MKNLLTVLSIILSLNGFSQQNELTWHTDVNKAINLSLQEEKPLFFFFTGSDWCGWCIKLQQQVFFKKEFKAWADKKSSKETVRPGHKGSMSANTATPSLAPEYQTKTVISEHALLKKAA